jgi:hypothetical protein
VTSRVVGLVLCQELCGLTTSACYLLMVTVALWRDSPFLAARKTRKTWRSVAPFLACTHARRRVRKPRKTLPHIAAFLTRARVSGAI